MNIHKRNKCRMFITYLYCSRPFPRFLGKYMLGSKCFFIYVKTRIYNDRLKKNVICKLNYEGHSVSNASYLFSSETR